MEAIEPVSYTHLDVYKRQPLHTGFEEYNPIFELIMKLYQENSPVVTNETPRIIEIFSVVFTKENDRVKLEKESTLGREENMERLKQFQTEEMKHKVVELLKYLNTCLLYTSRCV